MKTSRQPACQGGVCRNHHQDGPLRRGQHQQTGSGDCRVLRPQEALLCQGTHAGHQEALRKPRKPSGSPRKSSGAAVLHPGTSPLTPEEQLSSPAPSQVTPGTGLASICACLPGTLILYLTLLPKCVPPVSKKNVCTQFYFYRKIFFCSHCLMEEWTVSVNSPFVSLKFFPCRGPREPAWPRHLLTSQVLRAFHRHPAPKQIKIGAKF